MPPWPATITQPPQFQSGVAPYSKEMKTMTFALATFRIDGTPTPVLSVDGRHYKLADLAPEVLAPNPAAGLMTVFANWASAEPVLLNAVQRLTDEDVSCDEVPAPRILEDWLTPLQYPNKVICTGAWRVVNWQSTSVRKAS